jgi:TolB-like protein/DNA-binding SARP family transcriptional activator
VQAIMTPDDGQALGPWFAAGADRPTAGVAPGCAPGDWPGADLTLHLHLLGQMAAAHGGAPLALPKVRKTRAVLAILAQSAGRPVMREHITGLLWSTREREQARASLRQAAHELHLMDARLFQGTLIRSERHYLQLDARQVWVDVDALARATPTRPAALALLERGLLEDLHGLDPAFDAFLAAELRRLREIAAGVAAAVLAQQAEPAAVIAAARSLLRFAPAHEGAWRAVMRAYADRGDKARAIEAYESCAAALATTAHSFPSCETDTLLARLRASGLSETVLTLAPPLLAEPVPAVPVPAPRVPRRGVWLGVAAFRVADAADAAWLSEGFAEEITTALARFRWINLIAPASIAALAGEPSRDGGRWRQLNLEFLLDGSVQRRGARIRVTVRLLDLRAGGEVVWSRRFDRPAADLFTLQDEIAAETVAQVDPELLRLEGCYAAARPISDATAYELTLRAIPAIYRLNEQEYAVAGTWLAQAAERAPDSGTIFAWWACWHAFLIGQGWAPDPQAAMRRAGELAERAVTLDQSCARALSIAAYVRSFVQHQSIDETLGLHERALALNPNLPFAWAVSALTLSYAGRHDLAVERAEHARRLSPFDPHSFFFQSVLMIPHLALCHYETVVTLGRDATALNPAMSASYKTLLSALGHLRRDDEVEAVRLRLLALEPSFTVAAARSRAPMLQPADLENYLHGLRLAGLAEK